MPIFVDARIPVSFTPADAAGADDALLVEETLLVEEAGEGATPGARAGFTPGRPGHAAGCTCCAPRGAVAEALSRLFLARARGEIGLFRRVLVAAGPDGERAVRDALAGDAFLSGRYRLAE